MHPAVTEHPEYVAIRERLAEAERARATALEAGRKWEQEVQRLRREHDEAVRAATERGDVPPPAPSLPDRPDVAGALNRATSAREVATRDEREWLAANAADLLAALAEAERQLAKQAAPHVARLRELVPEWRAVAETVRRIEHARGRKPAEQRLTVGGIVEAVTDGSGFVPLPSPEPAPAPRVGRARDERDRMARARAKLPKVHRTR